MITKNDLVTTALEEIRVIGLMKKAQPKEITSAIQRMDNMVLGWQNKGLCLSYIRSEDYSDIDPNQDSGLNDTDAQAVSLKLAVALAGSYGKRADHDTRVEAHSSYLALFNTDLTIRESNSNQPLGSGHSFGAYTPKYQSSINDVIKICTGTEITTGETDSYTIDFEQYIEEIEDDTISSFVISDISGIAVNEQTNTEKEVLINVTGGSVGVASVLITITTALGRVKPRLVQFNIVPA